MDYLGASIVVSRKREAEERVTDMEEGQRTRDTAAGVELCLELLTVNVEEGGPEPSHAGGHWKLDKARQ